jgi:putative endonuclease
MEKSYWVYIVTDKPYGTLYTGVTGCLPRRSFQHREGSIEGFTKKYGLKILVYCEEHPTAYDAITREKRIKKWNRDWKIQLIEKLNPTWRDWYNELL